MTDEGLVRARPASLLAVCLALLPLKASEIVVAGRVIDENDAGIGGAEIAVSVASGGHWHLTTDPTGGFAVRLPAEGSYLFAASYPGYLAAREPDCRSAFRHAQFSWS